MTVEDLVKVLKDGARAEFGNDTHEMYRAGVVAIVRALRDEMDDKGHYEIHLMFNEILGSDAGEKVAGGPTREDGQGVEQLGAAPSHATTSPATNAAPAVCVWEVDGRNLWFARCPKQMGHRSYSQPPSHCPACKAPIKFTEAK